MRHGAYRMVGVYQPEYELNYFGVQGIEGWEDPPILDDPTETTTVNGREYSIYTDSGKIKLVAWHRGENSYWISNSLQQSLTNEQMMGIAESKPRDPAEEENRQAPGEQKRMSERGEAVGVIGVGWVGLVTAACFAELGHQVIARDILPEKVEALSRGEVKIHEPGLTEMIQRNLERITFTTGMEELLGGARLLFTCVDTPPTYSGDADLSRVRAVIAELTPTPTTCW